MKELIEAAEESGETISRLTLAQTAVDLGLPEDVVIAKMRQAYAVMKEAAQSGTREIKSMSGLTGGNGKLLKEHTDQGNFSGDFVGGLLYNAVAIAEVNSSMGKIVAAPTAGSCGVLPSCMITMQKSRDIPEEGMILALFNASAVGLVIANRASISGAEGGCQAECGTAAAMAASAMTEIMGGAPSQCGDAVGHVLKSVMGLICDPVAGLVEEPCIVRNAVSAAIATACAELALAGVQTIIPVDEVIDAMGTVGRQMHPSLRETAEGGIASSPTAKAIAARLLKLA